MDIDPLDNPWLHGGALFRKSGESIAPRGSSRSYFVQESMADKEARQGVQRDSEGKVIPGAVYVRPHNVSLLRGGRAPGVS